MFFHKVFIQINDNLPKCNLKYVWRLFKKLERKVNAAKHAFNFTFYVIKQFGKISTSTAS